ncbi:set5 [Symbiodinium natans]|uniref:Set5 protein n=1 Tax=Symbiodinium natans TaxID=878477 RepID=A0A812RFR9_9DINO|nr:set5 [Symbiodinium natans]
MHPVNENCTVRPATAPLLKPRKFEILQLGRGHHQGMLMHCTVSACAGCLMMPGEEELQRLFDALPASKQCALMDLQDSFADRDSEKTLLGVACTNAFQSGQRLDDTWDETEERVLYLELSRFNHSCCPNCEGSWDDRLGLLQIYACEDIHPGDELCLYYTDVRKPLRLRQEKLQSLGFTCACPVCSAAGGALFFLLGQLVQQLRLPDPTSDERRERLWRLTEEIPSCEDPEQAETIHVYGGLIL